MKVGYYNLKRQRKKYWDNCVTPQDIANLNKEKLQTLSFHRQYISLPSVLAPWKPKLKNNNYLFATD